MQSKVFFGFHVVKAYDYWWGYTAAQIELMVADQPIVVYPKKDEGKHTKKEMEELTRRWKEKKARDKESGKAVNLNDFLKSKKE